MRRVPCFCLLLANHLCPNLGRISHPQLVPQLRQHGLEPMRVTGGFDPHSHLTCKSGIKSSRLSTLVFQTPLHQLSCVRVQHGNLLVACVQIATYNHHRSAPFLRALVALSASKSTRSQGADTVIPSLLWVI